MESLVVQRKEGMWRKERMGESAWFVKTKSEIIFVQIFRWVREDKDSTGATTTSQDHRRKYAAFTKLHQIMFVIMSAQDLGPQLQTHQR